MGGGGSYYDRDTTSTSRRGSSGFSDIAQKELSRARVDKAVLPLDRSISCSVKSPLVYAFDVTGSMGQLPKIIYDKMPMIVGQIVQNKYLEDSLLSLAAVGDIFSDKAPVQIGDFSKLRSADEWLKRLWLEGNGGGGAKESYEMTAYFYANCCKMPNAENPLFLFTGDEGFYENLVKSDLDEHFGGKHQAASAKEVFAALKKNFKDNVFLIHREYGSDQDRWIVKQWKNALGGEHVVILPDDLAIADITLGVIALASGSRTLDQYIDDVKNRPLDLGGEKFEPQSPERIRMVKEALSDLDSYLAASRRRQKQAGKPANRPSVNRPKKDSKPGGGLKL